MNAADVSVIIVGIGSLLSIVLFSLKKIKFIRCGSCSCEQSQKESDNHAPSPEFVQNVERMMDAFVAKNEEPAELEHVEPKHAKPRPIAFFNQNYERNIPRTRSEHIL